jgi:hypothetical protein
MACDPATLAALHPILTGAGETDLLSYLAVLWVDAAGYTLPDDLNQLIEDSTKHTAMSELAMLQAEVALMWDTYESRSTNDELLNKTKCLKCLSPATIRAITMLMKCQYWQAQ